MAYQVEIMDAFSNEKIRKIVIRKAAQSGGSQVMFNMLGYIVDISPGPILWVQTTANIAKSFAKHRVAAFLGDNPVVGSKIDKSRSQLDEKIFPGGIMAFRGSRASGPLRERPIQYLFCDDMDGFAPSTAEGDPVSLARARLTTFLEAGMSKEVNCSSPAPSLKNPLGYSRIIREWEMSDRRRWHSLCPHCGEYNVLEWENVRWDLDFPESQPAWYEAECCGSVWSEEDRRKAVLAGKWVAERPHITDVAGFWFSALDTILTTLDILRDKWLDAEGNEEKMDVFYTSILAKDVEYKVEKPDPDRMYERRESYPRGIVPARACRLTAGVDIQADRIECEVVAWGRGMESWSVDYLVFEGKIAEGNTLKALENEVVNAKWEHACGGEPLICDRIGIDTGFETQLLYSWWRDLDERNRVLLMKGFDRWDAVIYSPPVYKDVHFAGRRIKGGARLWAIGSSAGKVEVHGNLNLPMADDPEWDQNDRYCHFPMYSKDYFTQLSNEERHRKRTHTGQEKLEWVRLGRNEALDCRVLALAAAEVAGFKKRKKRAWVVEERFKRVDTAVKEDLKKATGEVLPKVVAVQAHREAAQTVEMGVRKVSGPQARAARRFSVRF